MAINFSSIIGNLQTLGFYDFVLPWLLFFAVVLGVLNKSEVFGKEAKRTNAIIAAVIAFFISAYTPAGTTLAGYLIPLFGVSGMFAGVLLLLVIMAGTLGLVTPGDLLKDYGDWAKPIAAIVIVLLAALAFGAATGTGISIPGVDSDTATIIFVIVFVLLVVWLAESGGKKAATSGEKPAGK